MPPDIPEGFEQAPEDTPPEELFASEGSVPSEPWQIVSGFLHLVQDPEGFHREFPNLDLDDLVTPESVELRDLGRLRVDLANSTLTTKTRYLSPTWALILIVEDPGITMVAREPVQIDTQGAYVRYDDTERRWRLHMIGRPDIDPQDLP
jgi:hypothetical protein